MKNNKYVVISALAVIILIFMACWGIGQPLSPKRNVLETGYDVDDVVLQEEGTAVYAGAGDPGLSEQELMAPVNRKEIEKSRVALVKLLLEYNGYVPFHDGGRYWGETFPKFTHGIDNRRKDTETGYGVDSLGYVLWAYYQIFNEVIQDPAETFRNGRQIAADELLPGDIAMEDYQEDAPNHYGIFLGYDGDIPVFAHCDSSPYPNYPGGVSRLSSSTCFTSQYYMGTPPASFQYFTRPEVAWNAEPPDFMVRIKEIFSEYQQTKDTFLANACGDYGTVLYQWIVDENYEELLRTLNTDVMQKKGYCLEEAEFIKKIETLSRSFAGKQIMLYNTIKLDETDAIVARFCVAGDMESAAGEKLADSLHCLWLDMTIYKNSAGIFVRYLPFHESITAAAAGYGFKKE